MQNLTRDIGGDIGVLCSQPYRGHGGGGTYGYYMHNLKGNIGGHSGIMCRALQGT